jgi:hypothetical protein
MSSDFFPVILVFNCLTEYFIDNNPIANPSASRLKIVRSNCRAFQLVQSGDNKDRIEVDKIRISKSSGRNIVCSSISGLSPCFITNWAGLFLHDFLPLSLSHGSEK